jgi:hypothetical protein
MRILRLMPLLGPACIAIVMASHGALAGGLTTCAEFQKRLARADRVFGDVVPRFAFKDFDEIYPETKRTETREYDVQNVRDVSGQLDCDRKTDQLSSLELSTSTDGSVSAESAQIVTRFVISMNALTWAYTNWSKAKVQSVVGDLFKKALDEVKKSDLRGDKYVQGRADYEVTDEVSISYTVGGGFTFMIDASTAAEKK